MDVGDKVEVETIDGHERGRIIDYETIYIVELENGRTVDASASELEWLGY